jgi:hypothetical protein
MSEYGIAALYAVEAVRPEKDIPYTQYPSPELNSRRPCLDPVLTGGHPIRKPRIKDGVSFCEPIRPDWEW